VVTASVPRPTGGAERGGRAAFWPANREVADTVAAWLAETSPCPVVVVTNPVDRMVWRLYDQSGWPRERFLGYSLSETARATDALARRFDADPAAVRCPVLGEHGDHLVIAFSRATVAGRSVSLDATARAAVREYVCAVPYDVIAQRGQRDSSRWVTGRGAALLVDTLLAGGTTTPVCLSTPLAGSYDIEGVSLGVPVRLSRRGVDQVLAWELTTRERAALTAAAEAIRTAP
jgi:malate dehydrogenase